MLRTTPPLPNDIDALKALVAEQVALNTQLQAENHQHKAQILSLQEQLNLALARRYAASSEKNAPNQLRLFDEAEVEAEQAGDEDTESITIEAHTRKKCGRKPLPDTLPRVDIVHKLDDAARVCPHDGQTLVEIGEVTSEQLDIVPAKIQVLRHIRKKYACACGQCIKTAPLPAQPIPKSLASPGLLAHITVSKYQDALPLYRQETILQRIGVDIPRATLANWMIQAGTLIQPLINLLRDGLLLYDIIQMDETTVQVLCEPNKTAQSKSYLWVQRGGPPEQPVILFDYDPSRSQAVPQRLLEGFRGYLQTDGYDGYNATVISSKLTHVGCWAHARRKFSEAVKAQGKNKKNKKNSKAHRGLALIQQLYKIERHCRTSLREFHSARPRLAQSQARPLTATERAAYRKQHAQPVLNKLRDWLDQTLPQVPPKTTLGKALNYLHNEWSKLVVYIDDGRLEIDNNGAENAIRPFVIGRKNWLFSHSVKGVNASANLYSLIETAKANGLEPYAYLRNVFTELPRAECVDDIEALLPWNIEINESQK